MQAARETALRHELEAWQAQETAREAAEATERDRRRAQEAEQAAVRQEAEAMKEAARQKERLAWAAVSRAEAQYTSLQVQAKQYVFSYPSVTSP